MKGHQFLVFVVAGILMAPVTAEQTTTVEVIETQHTERVNRGAAWQLSEAEWNRYQQIMENRRGTWSPGLDPITALGVSADSAAERDRFAELYVRTEFERTRKELAFQVAVDRAWKRLYTDTPRLQSRAIPQTISGRSVRYALIVSVECPDCGDAISRRFSTMLEQAEEGVDVHVVGTAGDDQLLREWVTQQPMVLSALQAGRVTVNHGYQFADIGVFPAIYVKTEEGQWTREL